MNDEGIGAGVSRLILNSEFAQTLSIDLNFYLDFSRDPGFSSEQSFATVGSSRSVYRLEYLAWNFWQSGSVDGQVGFDRLNLSYTNDLLNVTVGRFPINYTVMNIFTPNDVFSPFSTVAINKIYKPGVDALRVGISPDMLSSLELVGVWGYDTDRRPVWDRSALLLRISTVIAAFEWSLLGGKLASRWFAGASLQGDIETIELRAEGHVGLPDTNGDFYIEDIDFNGSYLDDIYVHISTGVSKMFSWQNLLVGAEYMYLSDGVSNPSQYLDRTNRLFPDDQRFLSLHYIGITIGGDIISILRLNTIFILNTIDTSGVDVTVLVYNLADEAELVGGVLVPWGAKPYIVAEPSFSNVAGPFLGSEFGAIPLTVFLETRSYF